jgi:hypothetical protein
MPSNEQNKNSTSSAQDRLPPSLDADVAALAALLASTNGSTSSEQEELSSADLALLLRQLDDANGVAQGVESRLDGLIGALDGLLGGLGQTEGDEGTTTGTAVSDAKNERSADGIVKKAAYQENDQ